MVVSRSDPLPPGLRCLREGLGTRLVCALYSAAFRSLPPVSDTRKSLAKKAFGSARPVPITSSLSPQTFLNRSVKLAVRTVTGQRCCLLDLSRIGQSNLVIPG